MNISFCEAIARMEGWLVSSSRCRRNHNPGNIRFGLFAHKHGAIGSDGAFAIFKDDTAGFNAMSELLEANYQGDTIFKAISRYAPPSENNTKEYISNVCLWTGLTPDIVLNNQLLSPPLVGGDNGSQKSA